MQFSTFYGTINFDGFVKSPISALRLIPRQGDRFLGNFFKIAIGIAIEIVNNCNTNMFDPDPDSDPE
jgi:hypothetical protein